MKPVKRPPGRLCSRCASRELAVMSDHDLRVFQLKLRDFFNVERVDLVPCLSVCPSPGQMAAERRGKTMVLDAAAVQKVVEQFDPTRQLSFLKDEMSL